MFKDYGQFLYPRHTIKLMKALDEKYMAHALKLARLGGRAVAPNPMVGAVIIKNGKIIGQGYHQKFGGPHAEVNAIQSVRKSEDLKGATIYLTLEPCRHHGKTPPCLDLIKKVGITKVVCGSHDPFQKRIKDYAHPDDMVGRGLRTKFLTGPMAGECKHLNKFFFTWVTKKRPFVTVKIAMTADGFVAGRYGKQIHITDAKQNREVHKLRALHQAIMVGTNTVFNDNPRLNVRLIKGKDPLRVILDSHLRIPKSANVFRDKNFLVATTKKLIPNDQFLTCLRRSEATASRRQVTNSNIWFSPTKKYINIKKLLRHLADIGISSILVEPGPTLYSSLKRQNLIDELIIYRGKIKIKKGLRISL